MLSNGSYFKQAIEACDSDKKLLYSVKHNFGIYASINSAYFLSEDTFQNYDPWYDYWWIPERLFLVSFFSKYWQQRFNPAESLRNIVFQTFRHFELARKDNILNENYKSVDEFTGPNWQNVSKQLVEIINQMPEPKEFSELNTIRPRNLPGDSHKESLLGYLRYIDDQSDLTELWNTSYWQRVPFYPFLGLTNIEELEKRQAFFMAYYTLFTSTNSYKVGGAQTFAPILQNNATKTLMDYVRNWFNGSRPDEMEMKVNTKTDDTVNCNLYMPVVELYGFLNLKNEPFFNKAAKKYWKDFGDGLSENKSNIFKLTKRIGESSRKYLLDNHGVIKTLSERYDNLYNDAISSTLNIIQMEGVRSSKVDSAKNPGAIDEKLRIKLQEKFKSMNLSENEKAAVVLHLMLDAFVYNKSKEIIEPREIKKITKSSSKENIIRLPESLLESGNDALGLLKAGYHVLFAGAPGTGKTTLAQFVGYAWDNELEELKTEIPISSIPFATVANSAWAPFHTIGGILPDGKGNFATSKGIFIDPVDLGEGKWKLRNSTVILDEMNRADLDRCIGELYPILSSSVEKVSPAGIPGVKEIYNSEKFRLISTMNDSNLDDIVFPISEGLARRFQRIDLLGGTKDLIEEFIKEDLPNSRNEYYEIAKKVIDNLFGICEENNLTYQSEEGIHIPVGVGYFSLLKSWIKGELNMSESFNEMSPTIQAKRILKSSIISFIRNRRRSTDFQKFFDEKT